MKQHFVATGHQTVQGSECLKLRKGDETLLPQLTA